MTSDSGFEVDDVCIKYGIKYLGLFGSRARGEARADSDVDLLVRFDDNAKVGLFELDKIQRAFEIKLGKKVDLVTKMNKFIEPEAMRDLRIIYEKKK